ncbi:hypothetical protein [Vibrio nigripulchritudo]|uniref:hypothetical protein n=1 Tax=Vibrio nigripulchritudo TaxID=28173 RepID=UPI0003B1FE96|nr:hypothetical protein [Vibrio nigripulchritudo]CCN71351.1 conserved hypothetical protein [Vibrio nigripulchritudo SFn118]
MLKDLVIQGLIDFQEDCLKLCESHYPTVHNRGMSEHHLGLAFARRMASKFTEYDHPNYFESIESLPVPDQPFHFRVSSDIGTVWVHSHHLISASKSCREKLMRDIHQWQAEYGYAIQPNDLLVVIADHWFSKSKWSREIFSWWNTELPEDTDRYKQQGVMLWESEQSIYKELEKRFSISPCYMNFAHPLRRPNNQDPILKYIHLYSILEWHR